MIINWSASFVQNLFDLSFVVRSYKKLKVRKKEQNRLNRLNLAHYN